MRSAVDQKLPLVTISNAFLRQDGLHLSMIRRVTRHIGCQNDADEALAEGLIVVACKALQEVVIRLVQNREGLSGMEVLLH